MFVSFYPSSVLMAPPLQCLHSSSNIILLIISTTSLVICNFIAATSTSISAQPSTPVSSILGCKSSSESLPPLDEASALSVETATLQSLPLMSPPRRGHSFAQASSSNTQSIVTTSLQSESVVIRCAIPTQLETSQLEEARK